MKKNLLMMMTIALPILMVGASRSFATQPLQSAPLTEGNAVGNLQQNVDLNFRNFPAEGPDSICYPYPCPRQD